MVLWRWSATFKHCASFIDGRHGNIYTLLFIPSLWYRSESCYVVKCAQHWLLHLSHLRNTASICGSLGGDEALERKQRVSLCVRVHVCVCVCACVCVCVCVCVWHLHVPDFFRPLAPVDPHKTIGWWYFFFSGAGLSMRTWATGGSFVSPFF